MSEQDRWKRPKHWMPRIGDEVYYHSVIDGPVTSEDHIVENVGTLPGGQPVAWITGRAGFVSVDSLTPKYNGK